MASDIFVGSVSVGVVPDARGWNQDLRRQLVPSADTVGREYGQKLGQNITDEMGRAGEKSGGSFSDTFRKRVKAALDALPRDADGPVAELRRKLEALANTKIIDSDKAMRELAVIDTGLREVSDRAKGIDVRFDTREARVQLALLKRDVDSVGSGSGGGGGIISKVGRLFSGGGGGAGAGGAGAGGASGLASVLPGATGAINPYTIGAGIAALPFIAQTAAGGIVAALGGALAGVGILGAVMTGKLTKQFDTFKTNAQKNLETIGAAFVPVLQHILAMAGIVLDEMTPIFASVMRMIAGPFQAFVDSILTAFTQPAVKQSIEAVARAFIAILTAFTPDIPGIFRSVAESITAIAESVAKNPKAFADFLNFLAQIVIFGLRAIAVLTEVANWIESHWQIVRWIVIPTIVAVQEVVAHFSQLRHETAVIFDGIRHEVAQQWDQMYSDTVGRVIRLNQKIQQLLNQLFHNIANIYDQIRHYIASVWDTIWNNTVGRAQRGVRDLMAIFGSLRSQVIGFFSNAGSWLADSGRNIIGGLLNGIKTAMGSIGSWIKANVVDPLVGAVKHFFGIHSDSTLMMPIGRNLIGGLISGMLTSGANLGSLVGRIFGGWPQALASLAEKSLVDISRLPAKALKALGSVASKVGGFFAHLFGGHVSSGVSQWAGIVAQALGMLGLPLSLSPQVLYQMQTESGGNPNAINLTDINAQMGDPSRGLLQTIGSTFAAYHVAGTSGNIYDPLANVAAAINYARHVYGPTLMRGGMGMGSGHGYDSGGWLPPGVTMAVNMTGESELVLPASQLRAMGRAYARGGNGSSGPIYNAHFDSLTGAAIESHVQTAFRVMSLTEGALNRNGRRS